MSASRPTARGVRAGRAPRRGARCLLGLASSVLVSGCIHLVEPLPSPTLPLEGAPFPRGSRVRLINGHAEPEILDIRTEGLHSLRVDLRTWTAQLVADLAAELGRRGVAVASDPEAPAPAGTAAVRVRITSLAPPDEAPGEGARLTVEMHSADRGFEALYSTPPGARGFGEAFQGIVKAFLEDERLPSIVSAHAPAK